MDRVGDYWIAGWSYSDNTGNKTSTNYSGTTTSTDFWVIKDREKCTHDTICFKWVQPVTVPDSDIVHFNAISCDSISALTVKNAILQQVGAYIQSKLDSFTTKYTLTCASADSIQDTLSLSYPLGYFHYTLYYYDRAGNLVRTVAPNGVNYLTGSQLNNRLTATSHTFKTKYFYNSVKQLAKQETPDGGITEFWYDYKGELRFSRNAKQKAAGNYSYTKYDNLGRIVEVGQSTKDFGSDAFVDSVNVTTYPGSSNSQRTYTVYSTAATGIYYLGMHTQQYLQNRVSYTYTDDNAYTYYSYDPHGNVQWLIQDVPGLGRNYIRYEYDLISNKVIKVHYNEGASDEFHHWYAYDADQRIQVVRTSRNGQVWDKDASYKYYKHGPLKRAEIGEDKIQGIDYVYTINGWIKGINHPKGSPSYDPGNDGGSGSKFCRDVFGMVLGYNATDFNRTGSHYNPSDASLISSQSGISNLYNGNISSWTLKKDSATKTANYFMFGFKYRYDQLNRIKAEDFMRYTTAWGDPSGTIDNTYTYDDNGNILTLNRKGKGSTMDDFTYNYNSNTNQLNYVSDATAAGGYSTDLDNQASNHYLYDEIGEMKNDSSDIITWTVYGKVATVKKTNGDSLVFTYDASGNRIAKRTNVGGTVKEDFYVRDAQGNVMSNYERTGSSSYTYTQTELPIYGSDRVGVVKPALVVKPTAASCSTCNNPCGCINCTVYQFTTLNSTNTGYFDRRIAQKDYELKDHLGDVRVTIGDRKRGAANTDSVTSYVNYYAFGMQVAVDSMNYTPTDYRYGFNGKEKDDEWKSDGNSYDYGMRAYDPRLGKFLSVDPIASDFPWNSPYAFAEDDVIRSVDLDGKEKYIVHLDDKRFGGTWLELNQNKSEWSKGFLQYEGEDGIFYNDFQRKEERDAASGLDNARNTNPTTNAIKFNYSIKVKYVSDSKKIANLKDIQPDLDWVADRLKNNSKLVVTISADLGWASPSGKPIAAKGLDEKDDFDGKKMTMRQATIERGKSLKDELTKKGADGSRINVKEGKSLSGEENRKANLKFSYLK